MAEIVTPYTSQDLFLTKTFDDEFANQLVSRGGNDRGPFPRKIDLWWTAVLVGAAIGHRTPMPPQDQLTKFNIGAILGREPCGRRGDRHHRSRDDPGPSHDHRGAARVA